MPAVLGTVLYVVGMAADSQVRAWKPAVPGVAEVFHARFVDHAYPMHTHDTWALLIVDDGSITYDLDRHHHGARRPAVTVLPPHVPHDGRSATAAGFRKRVVYLESSVLDDHLIGAAVDEPSLPDRELRHRIHRLHQALDAPGDELEAESRLTFVSERLHGHLVRRAPEQRYEASRGTADLLREMLDATVAERLTLAAAAETLGAHPTHLVRAFTRRFGLPPHRYLTGRRVDLARRMLLADRPAAEVATAAGFYDQPHLTRHFRRLLGTTPARYAAG